MIHVSAMSCPRCGAVTGSAPANVKSRVTAGILALLLGGLGVHKFYCGKIAWGVVYLLFFWTYIPALVAFIEGIIYLSSTRMSDAEFTQKYCG